MNNIIIKSNDSGIKNGDIVKFMDRAYISTYLHGSLYFISIEDGMKWDEPIPMGEGSKATVEHISKKYDTFKFEYIGHMDITLKRIG